VAGGKAVEDLGWLVDECGSDAEVVAVLGEGVVACGDDRCEIDVGVTVEGLCWFDLGGVDDGMLVELYLLFSIIMRCCCLRCLLFVIIG